jgi:hypothetical protein
MSTHKLIEHVIFHSIVNDIPKPILFESVSEWETLKKFFKSNGVSTWNFEGKETITYSDSRLGEIDLYNDGTAYISDDNKLTTWTFKDDTIQIDNSKISTTQIKKSLEYDSGQSEREKTQKKLRKQSNIQKSNDTVATIETTLEWLGFIPGYGDLIDAGLAIWYFSQGKTLDGILSMIAVIPMAGSVIKAAFKGAINATGGSYKFYRLWKKATNGNIDDLANFYKKAIEDGYLTKTQLRLIAGKGDEIAKLLISSKSVIRKHETLVGMTGTNVTALMKQIDDIAAAIRNTTAKPIRQSLISKLGKTIKKATGTGAAKLANVAASISTLGAWPIAKRLVKKLGIFNSTTSMKRLKGAMDVRWARKIEQSPTLVTAMLRSTTRLPSAQLTALGMPRRLYARSTKEVQQYFARLQTTDPKKWKQVSNAFAKHSANVKNPYYERYVDDAFQQASNIFRPGAQFASSSTSLGRMFADVGIMPSPKNLDIIKNEIEDLTEKLGIDAEDDPNGVILPAVYAVYDKFLREYLPGEETLGMALGVATIAKDTVLGPSNPDGGDVEDPADTNDSGTKNTKTTKINSAELSSIKQDFKNAKGTTIEKLDALTGKGWTEDQILALKRSLDIE